MPLSEKVSDNILQIFVVDAFTKQPFQGNGAAICLLPFDKKVPKSIKQKIAAEMNLSETAFITLNAADDTFNDGKRFGLEWFTPVCEVSLCGHATVASAAVIFFEFSNQSKEIEFETASGILKAKQVEGGKIQIDLPAYKSHSVIGKYNKLVKAVAASLPVKEVVISDSKKLLIQLSDEISREELESIRTKDDELVASAPHVMGVIVTLDARNKVDCGDDGGLQYDFISRYFVPWLGISEDPVTGSAHSVLAPFWANILKKDTLYARQCSPRGGDLNLELVGDRVLLSGYAVIVMRGKISF